MTEWQIVNKIEDSDSNSDWIEEEDKLLNWAETPDFETKPLSKIAVTFIYVDNDNSEVGMIKTSVNLDHSSALQKSVLFDKVRKASNPNSVVSESDPSWLQKSYFFDEAAIYSIPLNHEQLDTFKPKKTFKPLIFAKDPASMKVASSLSVFHDLYEIFVIMREVKKSILKPDYTANPKGGGSNGKTKKVRISDDSPNEYVFSKHLPVSSAKRRTKRNR